MEKPRICLEGMESFVEQVVKTTLDKLMPESASEPQVVQLLTEEEAAEKLAVKRHVLRDARLREDIDFVRLGRGVKYKPEDLEQFIEKNRNRRIGD